MDNLLIDHSWLDEFPRSQAISAILDDGIWPIVSFELSVRRLSSVLLPENLG